MTDPLQGPAHKDNSIVAGPPATQPVGPMLVVGLGLLAVAILIAIAATVWRQQQAPSQPAEVTQFVTRLTRVRDAPTASGSQVIGNVHRGDVMKGTWVDGGEGSRWLKVIGAGGAVTYVWGANLTATAPIPLVSAPAGRAEFTPSEPVELKSEPRPDAPLIETLPANVKATIAGEVADDWTEVLRPNGGVGYILTETLSNTPVKSAQEMYDAYIAGMRGEFDADGSGAWDHRYLTPGFIGRLRAAGSSGFNPIVLARDYCPGWTVPSRARLLESANGQAKVLVNLGRGTRYGLIVRLVRIEGQWMLDDVAAASNNAFGC